MKPPLFKLAALAAIATAAVSVIGCSFTPTRTWSGPALTSENYPPPVGTQTPRIGYLSAKAAQSNLPLADVIAQDDTLSMSINPYSHKDAAAVASGKTVFASHCAQCHGIEADGSGPPPFTGLKKMNFHNSHKRMFVQMNGRAPANWFANSYEGQKSKENPDAVMPPQKDKLSREQLWLAITYLEHISATK